MSIACITPAGTKSHLCTCTRGCTILPGVGVTLQTTTTCTHAGMSPSHPHTNLHLPPCHMARCSRRQSTACMPLSCLNFPWPPFSPPNLPWPPIALTCFSLACCRCHVRPALPCLAPLCVAVPPNYVEGYVKSAAGRGSLLNRCGPSQQVASRKVYPPTQLPIQLLHLQK